MERTASIPADLTLLALSASVSATAFIVSRTPISIPHRSTSCSRTLTALDYIRSQTCTLSRGSRYQLAAKKMWPDLLSVFYSAGHDPLPPFLPRLRGSDAHEIGQ